MPPPGRQARAGRRALGLEGEARRVYEVDMSGDHEPGLDQAFFETDDPELRAFADRQVGRKVALLVAMLAVMFGAGGFVGWAIYHALR